MNDFTLVTVSSHKPREHYYTYDAFFESCRRHLVIPLVISGQYGMFRGLGSKPKFLRRAILDKTILTRHLIFADSWDLVFTGNPSYAIELFKSFDAPWVCSTEKNCFPSDLKDKFPECDSSYRYLNSGFIVAETDAMLAVLESMDLDNVPDDYRKPDGTNHHTNDQFLFQQAFVAQPIKMKLDYKCLLSWSLCNVSPDEIDLNDTTFKNLPIRNKETGIYPLTLHFNGGAKTDGLREPVLKALNLPL